jgi:hypothetical protein
VAAWDEGAAIYASRSADGETWSEPRRLTGDDVRASHPLVVPAADAAVVLWTESPDDGVPAGTSGDSAAGAVTRWAASRY